MPKSKLEHIFNTCFISLLFILIIGIPLIFTPLTRSVFEVNKLLLLRVITIFVYFLWLFRYILFKANGLDNNPKESISILSLRWKKMGLEVPILLWLILNILSTIFSQNIFIAIIGAYDRWEGIITIINYMMLVLMYAKLVTKRTHMQWLLVGIVGSTTLSSIYGILQSLGYDFMNWSVDPTMRVFACINNPVHFCAYVGMVVPLGLGWLLYFSAKEEKMAIIPKWFNLCKWLIFVSTILIYYSQFLSYSRATWMGFIGAMTLFYLIATNSMSLKTEKIFLLDMLFTTLGIAVFYLTAIFNFHQKSPIIAWGIAVVVLGYIGFSYFITEASKDNLRNRLLLLPGILLCYLTFIPDWFSILHLPTWSILGIYLLLCLIFISLSIKVKEKSAVLMSRLVIILVFAKLQFVAVSWVSMLLFFTLIISYYLLNIKGNSMLLREKKFWLIVFLFIFGAVLVIPTLPSHIAKLSAKSSIDSTLKATENAEGKVDSYKEVAIKGTARTSMWKSSKPWIKDYWLLGTGPDTVKYMYPKYRRPEYGKLEGGHNFTPDRLHNEYLNTLATRGILAGFVYYVGIILGWYFLILKGLYKMRKNPYVYILASLLAGVTVYLGQVMFNFGVVATLFLFYTLMGLGLALANHPDFEAESESERSIL